MLCKINKFLHYEQINGHFIFADVPFFKSFEEISNKFNSQFVKHPNLLPSFTGLLWQVVTPVFIVFSCLLATCPLFVGGRYYDWTMAFSMVLRGHVGCVSRQSERKGKFRKIRTKSRKNASENRLFENKKLTAANSRFSRALQNADTEAPVFSLQK